MDATMTQDAVPAPALCELFTAQDLAEICGVADVTIEADPSEGLADKPRCARRASVTSGDWVSLVLWRTDAVDAKKRFEDHRPAGKVGNGWIKIEALELGERAELEHNHVAMESQVVTLRVMSGADYFAVWQKRRDGKPTLCTDEQLVDLARRAFARIK